MLLLLIRWPSVSTRWRDIDLWIAWSILIISLECYGGSDTGLTNVNRFTYSLILIRPRGLKEICLDLIIKIIESYNLPVQQIPRCTKNRTQTFSYIKYYNIIYVNDWAVWDSDLYRENVCVTYEFYVWDFKYKLIFYIYQI